jgi:glycosyltransferase involved in cell wall biosynthesis
MTKESILVTVPVHNEAALLYRTIHELARGLDASGLDYRLSIAEDGSSDGTLEVVKQLRSEFPGLIAFTNVARHGRGWALRQIWTVVDADIYAFVDADLSAGPEALINVISAVRQGADVATGSRYCEGAVVHRPPLRDLVSGSYNQIVRTIFGDTIRDHQCGLKAFSREAKTRILAMTREDSWAWDTEAMVVAELAGMRVAEVPVDWRERRVARTPIRRLLSDVYLHGASLLRLKSGLEGRLNQGAPPPVVVATMAPLDGGLSQGKGSALLR